MSTFNGQVLEFPDIRVDFFRQAPGARPPLACFLSHVHSDHLAGLESLKAPFVYCSAATREILLRLERFPHRVNFQLGILQSRVQHYRHLKNLLKPLPLETPTRIELAPGKEIQVTLFDANHCTGSVMFLIEGDGKAILYTGDIRCEQWFVNGLRRNPILMEYTTGLKKLDCVYLDTTFTDDIHFPSKAEGLAELLKKIRKYPADTTFHFTAWTFGYEEVWVALSKALKSPIHVDQYKLSLYESLCPKLSKLEPTTNPAYLAAEAPALIGHHYGNNYQKGCLTMDPTVRIHSCEKGMRCPALTRNTVFIQPILARGTNGVEMLELGAGGGQGDLTHKLELEIDSDVFVQRVSSFFRNASKEVVEEMKSELTKRLSNGRNMVSLEDMGIESNAAEISLEDLVKAALHAVPKQSSQASQVQPIRLADEELPRTITFPYSRHASYEELCDLVSAFQPSDVYPCTVDERKWFAGVTMKSLFGQCCDESTNFRHDKEMQARYGKVIAGATQTQHPSQDVASNDDEPVFSNFEIRIPVAAPLNHKRKAEDPLGSNDKRARAVSTDLDAPVDLEAMSLDMSDDDGKADEADPHDVAFWQHHTDDEANTVWDPIDGVWRCKECGWEKWYRFRDCECEGDFGVIVKEDKEMSKDGFRAMHTIDGNGTPADIDLMDSPPCYDSVSDASDDEYERDSFVDDAPLECEGESEKDDDYEVDDKERYLEALRRRNTLNGQFVSLAGCFAEEKSDRMQYDSDYETDLEAPPFIPNNEDSDSEAQVEDPDYRYLWKKMKENKLAALMRLADMEKEFEEFRREAPGYVSEHDPYNSAYDEEFDSEIDLPRSALKKTVAENEVLKRKWAKECEKFLRLYKELLASKNAFRELREAVLGEGNDRYRDVATKYHLTLMEDLNGEPHPYGAYRPYDDDEEMETGLPWALLFSKAHMRVHSIEKLLREERKTFKDWRRSNKNDYVSYEDPYDSEDPTTVEGDDAEAQYLDEQVQSLDSEVSDWYEYHPSEIPSMAGDGRYRKLWNHSCRAFNVASRRLQMRKNIFRKYRAQHLGPDEIDTYIEQPLVEHGDKVLNTDNEPRPHGAGKLGRYGNDERGWDWKGLAEKARARHLKVRRLMKLECDAYCHWRVRREGSHEQFERYGSHDPHDWVFKDDIYHGEDYAYWPVGGDDREEFSKQADVTGQGKKLYRTAIPASPQKKYRQSRVTRYFPEIDSLPWHLMIVEKKSIHKLEENKVTPPSKRFTQTRVTDYMAGHEHLWTATDKKQNHRRYPVGGRRAKGKMFPKEIFPVEHPVARYSAKPGNEMLATAQNPVEAEKLAADGPDDDYEDEDEEEFAPLLAHIPTHFRLFWQEPGLHTTLKLPAGTGATMDGDYHQINRLSTNNNDGDESVEL